MGFSMHAIKAVAASSKKTSGNEMRLIIFNYSSCRSVQGHDLAEVEV
jgi:hypothetical protein